MTVAVASALTLAASVEPRAGQSVPRFPSVPLGGDLPPADPRSTWDAALVERWLSAAEQHTPGSIDGPLAAAAGWTSAELRRLWVDVQVLLQVVAQPRRSRFEIQSMASDPRPASGSRPASPRVTTRERAALEALAERVRTRGVNSVVKRAAVLHTDVTTLGEGIAERNEPGNIGAGVRLHVGDGTTMGIEGVSLHLELARVELSHIEPDPKHDLFVRDWYRATVATGQRVEFFDVPHLAQGLRLFPDDPELLLLAAAEREALATPLFQAFARSFTNPVARTGITSSGRELSAAERFYRRALEADAEPREVRVRLGRVLTLQGRYAEAARELRQAGEGPEDPLLGYYTALFLGAALEGMGDLEAARESFRRATALSPAARAAHLAVARIARELGDREETTESLNRAVAPVAGIDDMDPLWTYRAAAGRRRAAWLDDVRVAAKVDRP
jgi:hypothetical protein